MSRNFLGGVAIVVILALTAVAVAEDVVHQNIPDAELLNQDGESVRFLSEVIGDKLAAITFTFTSCHTICPRLDGIFAKLQGQIADDLVEDTVLVTVSVDPVNDIPERLKAHSEMMKAGPGWSFITGEKERVNDLLKALEVFAPDILEHPPTVFVVDGRRGEWTRLSGFPSPDKIAELLGEYRQGRSEESKGVGR